MEQRNLIYMLIAFVVIFIGYQQFFEMPRQRQAQLAAQQAAQHQAALAPPTAAGESLAPGKPLTLSWDNGAGLKFSLIFALDDEYMFTVGQKVENSGAAPVEIRPYSRAHRSGTPKGLGFAVLHEGPIGVLNDTLITSEGAFFGWLWGVSYSDVVKAPDGNINYDSKGGWLGFTDKYWLVSLIAEQKDTIFAQLHHDIQNKVDQYQAS